MHIISNGLLQPTMPTRVLGQLPSKWHLRLQQHHLLHRRHHRRLRQVVRVVCFIQMLAMAIMGSCRWHWAICRHRRARTSQWIPTFCPKVRSCQWPLATPETFVGKSARLNYGAQNSVRVMQLMWSSLLQPAFLEERPSSGRPAVCRNWPSAWAWAWMHCGIAGGARRAPCSVTRSCRVWRSVSRRSDICRRRSASSWRRRWVWARRRSRRGSRIVAWSIRSSCDDATRPMVSGQQPVFLGKLFFVELFGTFMLLAN